MFAVDAAAREKRASLSRAIDELWDKALAAVGIRLKLKIQQWPENLKASRAGKLMMWGVAWGGVNPDGQYYLELLYGPNKGQANHSRFDLPAYNGIGLTGLQFAANGTASDWLGAFASLGTVTYTITLTVTEGLASSSSTDSTARSTTRSSPPPFARPRAWRRMPSGPGGVCW